jgi:hypothetical protein
VGKLVSVSLVSMLPNKKWFLEEISVVNCRTLRRQVKISQ